MAEKDPAARLRRAVKENNLFLVKRLIERTDIRNTDPGPRRYTSLAWAAVLGHEETFEFLLSEGHDDYEYSRDADNNTILMLLADQKPTSPAPYHAMPSNGDTMRATLRMARLYYDRYPKVLDWSNNQGKTALHIAALKGKEELVRMLCELDADVDLPDNKGNSPLHSASAWGHIPVVQLLIERGCSHTARNNENFTATDYAYSFSTQETLMDTVRIQFENNKRSRRLNAQGSRNNNGDPGGAGPSNSSVYRSQDVRSATPRMRSGSGTSRTTETSDSGEMDSTGLAPPLSQSSLSASSSPSHPSAVSNTQFQTPQQAAHSVANGSMSALSPFAKQVRERDADAREKYMSSRRNRSGSQGTSSTDNKSQNGSLSAGPSGHGDDITSLNHIPPSGSTTPRRRLRPSMSASQLLSKPPPASSPQPPENRIRAGTNPSSSRPAIFSRPLVSRSSSVTSSCFLDLREEAETYTGPPSQYAQFPEPPLPAEDNSTPLQVVGWDSTLE
ncbi:ankyrin repeat-containing domain protein [Mucidula mucida]|nr:ankyrin repeat-containing domain protein [Mucidula mucida]